MANDDPAPKPKFYEIARENLEAALRSLNDTSITDGPITRAVLSVAAGQLALVDAVRDLTARIGSSAATAGPAGPGPGCPSTWVKTEEPGVWFDPVTGRAVRLG